MGHHGGSDATLPDWSPIPFAGSSAGDHTKAVRELLTKGTDVNAKTAEGYTALHLAVLAPENKRLDIVAGLFSKGADVNATATTTKRETALRVAAATTKETALHVAVTQLSGTKETKSVINLLLNHGANLEAVDASGMTPLMHAVQRKGSTKHEARILRGIVEHLVERGANIRARDVRSRAPRQLPGAGKYHDLLYDNEDVRDVPQFLEEDDPEIVEEDDPEIVEEDDSEIVEDDPEIVEEDDPEIVEEHEKMLLGCRLYYLKH